MGTIKSGLFISLDGVIESPDKWHFGYFNDEMGAVVGGLMSGNDATLLGRQTYEEFASYWPNADPNDPMTKVMNESAKYVVSDSLTEATWQNTTLVTGEDIPGQIRELKKDKNFGTTGSATLVRTLLENELLDELHLLIHPVVLGSGKQLFEGSQKIPLKLISSTPFSNGVIHTVYTNE